MEKNVFKFVIRIKSISFKTYLMLKKHNIVFDRGTKFANTWITKYLFHLEVPGNAYVSFPKYQQQQDICCSTQQQHDEVWIPGQDHHVSRQGNLCCCVEGNLCCCVECSLWNSRPKIQVTAHSKVAGRQWRWSPAALQTMLPA